MNLTLTTTDNVAELLAKIIAFTDQRDKILSENMFKADVTGFIPHDLDISGFAELMALAVQEHVKQGRLLLRDSGNIKFQPNGRFDASPIIDDEAKQLLETDRAKYLKLQIKKLSENMMNKKVAGQLLEKARQNAVLSKRG
jgi:flagellar basal body rod protein FlgB